MTNAEKYLKDGVDVEEFVNDLHYIWWANEYDVCEGIRKFLSAESKKKKPTLTEDERVILKNINRNFTHIYRLNNRLQVADGEENYNNTMLDITAFGHLFQFIKNGEEYPIEELLNE